MKLIINADDFGLSNGQNYGIIDCYANGVVAATTLLSTGNAFDHACLLAKKHPDLDIGVHLSLDLGTPLSDGHLIPSLLDDAGAFRRYNLEDNVIDVCLEEVYIEWRTQIEKVIAAGLMPSHIDSHHHIHMMMNVFPIYLRLAREFQLAIRFHPRKWRDDQIQQALPSLDGLLYADRFLNSFYGTTITPDFFATVSLEEGKTYEMMCHPAYLDQWIMGNSSYNIQRSIETETLQASQTQRLIQQRGIQLINFRQL